MSYEMAKGKLIEYIKNRNDVRGIDIKIIGNLIINGENVIGQVEFCGIRKIYNTYEG